MNKIISLAGKGTPQELTQGLKCSTLDPLKVSSTGNGADIWPSMFQVAINLISLLNLNNFIELSDCYQYDPSI